MINEPSTVEQTTSNNTNSAITVPSLDIDPNIDSMSSIRNQTLPGRDGKEVMTYKGTADGYNYYADSIGNVYRRPVSGGSWEDCGCKSDSLTYSNNSTNTETTKEIYSDFGTYTTSADSNKIRNSIASEIDVIAKDIEKLISDIYKKIDGMPNNGAWEGESYNAFKNSVTSYKKNLDEFVTILKAFVVLFNNAADDTDDLGNIIDEIIGDL